MDTLWDRVKKNLVDWYGTAYEITDELARVGKKKIEVAGVNRAIEKHLSELGGKVYDLIEVQGKGGIIAKDSDVSRLVEEIRGLEEQLKIKEKEIEAIRAEKKREEASSKKNFNKE